MSKPTNLSVQGDHVPPSSSLAAACMAAGLASAWTPSAMGDVMTRIDVESTLAGDVSHAVVLFNSFGSGSGGPGTAVTFDLLQGVQVGGDPWRTFEISSNTFADFGDSYAMLAIYGKGSGGQGLVVSTPGLTVIIGVSFENAFPGFSEQVLIDDMLTGGNLAEAFLRTNFALLLTPAGTRSDAVAFSQGAPFGGITFTATAIPAPSAFAVLTAGAFASMRRSRRGLGPAPR